jgi:heme/copper-type cytochrome/quinol oxidase subunit 2
MRGAVVVAEEAAYQAWLSKQQTFVELYKPSSTKKANLTPVKD